MSRTARSLLIIAAVCVAAAGAYALVRWRADLFGPGAWGTGGNLVAWLICGGPGFGVLGAKTKAWHAARMDQAARQHAEQMAQADAHNAEQLRLAGRHQQELLDRADAHHEALKAHISRVVADAQVSGGAGADPATHGFAADPPPADPLGTPSGERAVQPPATTSKSRPPRTKSPAAKQGGQ